MFAAYPDSSCNQQLVVTGAGAAVVNGNYFADGSSTGATRYTKASSTSPSGVVTPAITMLRWSDGYWYISALGPDRIPDNGDDTDYCELATPPTFSTPVLPLWRHYCACGSSKFLCLWIFFFPDRLTVRRHPSQTSRSPSRPKVRRERTPPRRRRQPTGRG
eukprot:SAG11_NODE_632_length_8057_cov_6.472481_4_plen_161_part_00